MGDVLGNAFWGDGGSWIIVDGRLAFGPFFSADVAHCWRGDMVEASELTPGALLLNVQPPRKPQRRVTK